MTPLKAVSSLVVLDLGVGLGAALVAAHFTGLGAQVRRLEPEGGDPFHDRIPAYGLIRAGAVQARREDLDAEIARADVCILGGEDLPGLDWRFDAKAFSRKNPRLVVLNLTGGIDADGGPAPAVDLLAQASSGLCWEQFSDRPMAYAVPAPTFAMATQGLMGTWGALFARERTGAGQVVTASLQMGAAVVCAPDRVTFEQDDADSLAKIPIDVRQLIFECSDGGYLQFAMQRTGALARVYKILGIPGEVDPLDPGSKRPDSDPRDFFGDYELFAEYVAKQPRDQLLKAFWENGISAEPVLEPGECWDHEQTRVNDIVRTLPDGSRKVGLPIRLKASATLPQLPAIDEEMSRGPLTGIRVIGLGAFIAGPFTGRCLADLGADVIKVDAPSGDPNTKVYSAWYVCNAGKRGMVLDVKTAEGREVLRRLCNSADVIHSNFRSGVAERLGLDAESLRSENPRLITLESSAYGAEGPKASLPGLDPILQAVTGLESRSGGEASAPMWYRNALTDYTTGVLGCIGILIGLFERQRSGVVVDAQVNLLDSSLFLMSELVQAADGEWLRPRSIEADHLGFSAMERLYPTRDGWIAVAAIAPDMAARFTASLGLEQEAGADEIAARLAVLDTEAALRALRAADVWCEPCVRVEGGRLETDARACAAGLLRVYDDPRYGRVTSTGPAVRLSRTPLPGPARAPGIGENTAELMRELGYSEAQIQDYVGARFVA